VHVFKRQLVLNEKQNQNASRHADGQTGDIDERIPFVPQQISQRDGEVVFEH
jgi:hypothetical protein